jgi:outer membrane putative beta-barrel porin/alpha-amylase
MKHKPTNLNTLLLSFIILILPVSYLSSQGCVAIRGFSGCTGNIENGIIVPKGDLLVGTNFRYFKSYRHFRSDHEETNRVEDGTQVINNSSFLDFSATYGISNRLYANLIIPFVYHTRSSMYEHGGNPPNGLGDRHETSAAGIADIRLGAGYWLLDQEKHPKVNYAVGVGVKLPTGNYSAKDVFYNQGENKDTDIEKVVDQSIQPGDGGFGITTEIQGFHVINDHLMLLSNLYYLINPQESNGVLTRNGRSEFSCPDQYAVRSGVYYSTKIHGLSTFLGGRMEGIPASDLIGSSAGYRRPGFAVSVEPGVGFSTGNASFNLTVPIALYRNRTQSYEDKVRTAETGEYRHGDAAFADYLVNFSFSYKFAGKQNEMKDHIPSFEKATDNF